MSLEDLLNILLCMFRITSWKNVSLLLAVVVVVGHEDMTLKNVSLRITWQKRGITQSLFYDKISDLHQKFRISRMIVVVVGLN